MTAQAAPSAAVGPQSRLTITPITLREANAYVARLHRHHQPVRGCFFCIGDADAEGAIRGVAIVGRPVSRMLQDGYTAEVTRVCTDGCPNACSALYGACWRAARAMGYRRIGTYTLATEPGTSLVAAGWKLIGEAGGGSWSREGRPRVDLHPTQLKLRWEVVS
jgi:hypothetical protein